MRMLIPSVTLIILLSCLTFQAAVADEKDKVRMRAMLEFNRKELKKSNYYPDISKEGLSTSDLILAVKWNKRC
ncbi:MAG: hypothetical protein PHY93_08065 [Bacteriovorax sp.]|nr:hypothetical protein [Bacteriovorax sp.]